MIQLYVLIGVYLLAGLPLWLTPLAHLVELIRKKIRSVRKPSVIPNEPVRELSRQYRAPVQSISASRPNPTQPTSEEERYSA